MALLTHPLWIFNPQDVSHQFYHWFNLLEGTAWIVLAVLVLARYVRQRSSALEIAYSAAFLLFGLSDFREAYRLDLALILAKGAILLALFLLRRRILRDYYPQSKLY